MSIRRSLPFRSRVSIGLVSFGAVLTLVGLTACSSGRDHEATVTTTIATPTSVIKYTDDNGVTRMTIKEGSPRTPGSEHPHVEIRNPEGERTDPFGNSVTRKSPDNHTPIDWDLPPR